MKIKTLFSFLLFVMVFTSASTQVSQKITLTNVKEINSKDLEFSPVFYHKGVVYVSSHYDHGKKDKSIGENTFELLYSDLGPQGKLSKAAPMSLNINTRYHEGPVSFSEDMQTMYFTRSNLKNGEPVKDKNGKIQLKIYQATKGKKDWEKVTELSFNSDEYTCMHPSISTDGKRLYFASNRPGGMGGMDLYYVDIENDVWGTPINLGPAVNTGRTEAFPYVHTSGKLFFSSNREFGKGGLDIFMVDVIDDKVGEVQTLPDPINSFRDDLGFVVDKTGKIAFFSSDRVDGKGKDDVYRADIPDGIPGLFPPKVLEVIAKVNNRKTSEAIPGAQVRLVEVEEDRSIYEMEDIFEFSLKTENKDLVIRYRLKEDFLNAETAMLTDDEGLQILSVTENKMYLITVSKEGFEPVFYKLNTYVQVNSPVQIYLDPKDLVVRKSVEVVDLTVGSLIVLDKLYYDFDKSYIRTDASEGLDAILALMKQYSEMMVTLEAHTDSRGSSAYNMNLSKRRAASAKYYLTSRGISSDRIVTLAKGETEIRNQCSEGVKCTEAEHQYNRRSLIRITNLGTMKKIEYINNAPEYVDRPFQKSKGKPTEK